MGDWRAYCRDGEGLSVEGDAVIVTFPDERRHRVDVAENADLYELTSVVVRQSAFADLPDGELRAWRRNRVTQLVGFRVDRRGRLVGEAWVPKDGLRQDEFLLYVRKVAAER